MKRHDFDPVSFIFGLAFTGLSLLLLVGDALALARTDWLWPTLLIAFGTALLLSTYGDRQRTTAHVASVPSDRPDDPTGAVDTADEPDGPPAG